MGFVKKTLVTFLNKRHYYKIKMYSYYRKDLWGFLKLKRFYKYKKVIYSILRLKKRFYGMMLYKIYGGIKFFNKSYRYRGNLYLIKKRLKLFYGHLKDKYIGKLGLLVKRKNGELVNYFYSLLERRIDVLLYRALYSLTVRFSRKYILQKCVYINDSLVKKFGAFVYVGDFIYMSGRIMNYFFFRYGFSKYSNQLNDRQRFFLRMKFILLKWHYFEDFYLNFAPIFFKQDYYLLLPQNKGQFMLLFYNLFYKIYVFFFVMYRRLKFLYKKNIISSSLKIIKNNQTNEMLRFLKKKMKYKRFRFLKKYFIYINQVFTMCSRFWAGYVYAFNNEDHSEVIGAKEFINLFGLLTFRTRVKKLFWFLKPLKLSNIRTVVPMKYRRFQRLGFKKYRKWRFSKLFYYYLKKLHFFFFIYKGYLAHMEVNYKIHVITLVYNPNVKSVTYSFGINKFMFFEYFKIRSYF